MAFENSNGPTLPAPMLKRASIVEDLSFSQRSEHSTSSTHTYTRYSSEASRLVGCFQELNDRLSAFERLAQLKQMVLEGKLKQDVFEEMYRINTEKLVDRKGRRKTKKFEVSAISVLDDFCVKHRTVHASPTILEMASSPQFKMKRGCLYFDRIVLRSAATFGSNKETILIGTQALTLMFYDDEPSRVDLQFEKRQEQFVFDTEVEMLMFVEALDKALDTAARSCISKDEPVLLGRPARSRSQISKDFDARKNACLNLETMMKSGSSPLLSKNSGMQSFATSASSLFSKDSEDYENESSHDDVEEEEKNEDEEQKFDDEDEDDSPMEQFMIASASSDPTCMETPVKQTMEYEVIPEPMTGVSHAVSTDSIHSYASYQAPTEQDPEDKRRCEERARIAETLGEAKKEREEAFAFLEAKKAEAADARVAEANEQKALQAIKAEEDSAIKDALAAREEDMHAAKTLADCVANEITAVNALDPDDVLSAATTKSAHNQDQREFPMSNDLRTLIGKPKQVDQPQAMSPYARLQYNLQQARKALASARSKVEKSSEKRRLLEAARREARRKVTAQMARCSQAGKHVTHCEGCVLSAKAALGRIEARIAHHEHCLLISVTHELQKQKLLTPAISRPSSPMPSLTPSSTLTSPLNSRSLIEVASPNLQSDDHPPVARTPDLDMAYIETSLIT